MICGLCNGKMKCTKVAYERNWIRRRRACQSCGTTHTSRERFDGAQLVQGGRVVPENWTVADCESNRAWLPTLHADARRALDAMVRDSYRDGTGRVQDAQGSNGSREVMV